MLNPKPDPAASGAGDGGKLWAPPPVPSPLSTGPSQAGTTLPPTHTLERMSETEQQAHSQERSQGRPNGQGLPTSPSPS